MRLEDEVSPGQILGVLVGAAVLVIVAAGVFSAANVTFDSGAGSPAPAVPPPPPPPPEPVTDLELSVDTCNLGRHHTRIEGSVRNAGETTVHFVTVEVRWYDSAGEVVDTGTTYAVGSERLRPGDSSRFTDFSQARGVERCGAELEGWRVVE